VPERAGLDGAAEAEHRADSQPHSKKLQETSDGTWPCDWTSSSERAENQGGIRTNTVGKKHRCTKSNRCIQYRLRRLIARCLMRRIGRDKYELTSRAERHAS
jgi:hypothetical protein